MKAFQWQLFLFFLGALLPKIGWSEVKISGRHVYIVYPGVDSVWGSYLFLVSNSGTTPSRFTFPVLLPKETLDFQGQENLSPEELKLGPEGGLIVDKEFPPGDMLLNIGFQLPADKSRGVLSLRSDQTVETMSLFVWQDSMKVEGQNLEIKNGVPFSGRFYDTYTVRDVPAGQVQEFTFVGVPEGRGRLWIIGWLTLAILSVIGLTLAYLSRPKHIETEAVV